LSPGFPPTAPAFCAALARKGITVLGIGDRELRPELRAAWGLAHYVFEPRMQEHQPLRDAVESLQRQFGRIERIDSNGEHWLAAEARLRDELDVPGLGSRALQIQRSKLHMASFFSQAGIAYPPTVPSSNATAVRQLAAQNGYPLVCKPETGSGAVDTFSIENDADLEALLERDPTSYVVQPFISGQIITFDGLADREGRILFFSSHAYDRGIMQIRRGELDGYYWSLRALPPGLEDVGRRAVAAFDVRERFFHVEFFKREDGTFTALEMNLRPPGGFTTDMMNAACEVDVYALWASVMAGEDLSGFRFERLYHTAHAGRRAGRNYRLGATELRAALGPTLFAEHAVPPAFAATMGDTAYLLRHAELPALEHAIRLVQDTHSPAT